MAKSRRKSQRRWRTRIERSKRLTSRQTEPSKRSMRRPRSASKKSMSRLRNSLKRTLKRRRLSPCNLLASLLCLSQVAIASSCRKSKLTWTRSKKQYRAYRKARKQTERSIRQRWTMPKLRKTKLPRSAKKRKRRKTEEKVAQVTRRFKVIRLWIVIQLFDLKHYSVCLKIVINC